MIPSYLLVCDELPERRDGAIAHLWERGLEPTVWKGFHGRSWGLMTTREYDKGQRISPGHVGLNTGSWAMWQAAMLGVGCDGTKPWDGDEELMFFEDDVCLPVDFKNQLNALFWELDQSLPDWDLVFLGLAEVQPNVWGKVTDRLGDGASRLCVLDSPFGTHALLVRRRALPVLLEHMRHAERNLDQQLWKYVLQPGLLKWCAVLPSIVTQRTFDYEGTGKPEWVASTIHADDPMYTPTLPHHPPAEHVNTRSPEEVTKAIKMVEQDKNGIDVHQRTLEMTDPIPCAYRGEGVDEIALSNKGFPVPLWECARLDKLCFNKKGIVLADPKEALRCETCEVREQLTPPEQLTRLPLPEGHFNCSAIKWDNRLILASRDSWGHSKVALWEMTNTEKDWSGTWTAKAIGSFASDHSLMPRLEDPRLFIAPSPVTGRPHLCSVFSCPDGYPPELVKVGYVRFKEDLSGIEHSEVLDSPYDSKYEKNWLPLVNQYGTSWVYGSKPNHEVIQFDKDGKVSQKWITPNPLPWKGGAHRGGAVPVFVSRTYAQANKMRDWGCDVHYHFHHGVLKRIQGAVYSTGCTVFEAQPPYRVLAQTRIPLQWADNSGNNDRCVKRYVLFIGGAIPHHGHWNLFSGIDDTYCRHSRISFAVVNTALNTEPEEDRGVGIRDTPISLGSRGQ